MYNPLCLKKPNHRGDIMETTTKKNSEYRQTATTCLIAFAAGTLLFAAILIINGFLFVKGGSIYYGDNFSQYFAFIKNAESRKSINEGDTKRRSFKRLHRYRYSPTTCFGNNEVFLHPYKNRRLTVREALRIQSVDDKYVWGAERQSAKFKVIGNGVPVLLAEAVAEKLFNLILSEGYLSDKE